MSGYRNYVPNVTLTNIEGWTEKVTHGVNADALGMTEEQLTQLMTFFANAHETTSVTMRLYIDQHIAEMNDWYNSAF